MLQARRLRSIMQAGRLRSIRFMHIKFPLPGFTQSEAIRIAEQHYAIGGSAEPLSSERDQNFLIAGSFVLKIANVLEDREALDLQNGALTHLAATAPDLKLPRVCKTITGKHILTVESDEGIHLVRLLTYVPARIFATVKPHTPELLKSLGKVIASLDVALQDFQHPFANRDFKWDLTRASWIREYLPHVEDAAKRAVVERYLAEYESSVLPVLRELRSTPIYNDANDYNILVDPNKEEIIGFIDFGDMVCAPRVCDLAI